MIRITPNPILSRVKSAAQVDAYSDARAADAAKAYADAYLARAAEYGTASRLAEPPQRLPAEPPQLPGEQPGDQLIAAGIAFAVAISLATLALLAEWIAGLVRLAP